MCGDNHSPSIRSRQHPVRVETKTLRSCSCRLLGGNGLELWTGARHNSQKDHFIAKGILHALYHLCLCYTGFAPGRSIVCPDKDSLELHNRDHLSIGVDPIKNLFSGSLASIREITHVSNIGIARPFFPTATDQQ